MIVYFTSALGLQKIIKINTYIVILVTRTAYCNYFLPSNSVAMIANDKNRRRSENRKINSKATVTINTARDKAPNTRQITTQTIWKEKMIMKFIIYYIYILYYYTCFDITSYVIKRDGQSCLEICNCNNFQLITINRH